jgi:protocatechuate 3,4-dioxygenase beta subunit
MRTCGSSSDRGENDRGMSRFSVRHVVVAAFVLLAAGAAAFWLRDAETSTNADAPPSVETPPPAKTQHAAPAKARRTKSGVATSPDAPRAAVVVRVIGSTNRAAIDGAAVYVTDGDGDDWRAETDAEGAARFDELAVGQATVHAEAKNRVSANRTAVLVEGANKVVEVELDDAVAVEGTVVDAESGAALAAATVQFFARDVSGGPKVATDETKADAQGRFRFADAPAAGVVNVTASASDHSRGSCLTALPAAGGAVARVDFRLDRTGTLRGVVRDPDGRPVDGAWVHVAWRQTAGAEGGDAVTDESGAFVVHDVRVGDPLRVTAGAPGWSDSAPLDVPMFARGAMDRAVDVALRRCATLVVRVLEPSGVVVAGATASLDGSWAFASNADHSLVRKDVAPGTHALVVRAAGFPELAREVVIAEGERAEVVVQLVAGVSVSGVVVDETGNPVVGASVWVVDADAAPSVNARTSGRPGATSGDGGSFRIEMVAPGRRGLLVTDWFADAKVHPIDAPADGVRIVVPAAAAFVLHVALPPGAARPKRIHVVPNDPAAGRDIGVDVKGSNGIDLTDWMERSVVRGVVSAKTTKLWLDVAGYVPQSVAIRPEPGKEIDLGEVRLDVGVTLKGRVVDGAGHPIARVSVYCSAYRSGDGARTADDGTFEMAGVARGRVLLRVFAGARTGLAVVDATDDAPRAVIVLRQMGVLRGLVVDAAGTPVRDAAVLIRHAYVETWDGAAGLNVTTDARGAFEAAVAAGRCRVSFGDASAETTVPEGGESSVRVVTK